MLARLRQDNDKYWYLIPTLYIADFDEIIKKMKYIQYKDSPYLYDDFNEFFGKFMIDNPFQVDCIINEKYY